MSNLAYASKIVETAVAKQLQRYLFSNDLFPVLQSAYRRKHSIEKALLKVTNDILLNLNDQRVNPASSPRLKCGFWHCRSRHFTASTSVHIWYKWKSPLLVFVLPVRKVSANGLQWDTPRRIRVAMWCPSRFLFRPLIIYSAFEQTLRDHQTSFSYDSFLRWRHAGIHLILPKRQARST